MDLAIKGSHTYKRDNPLLIMCSNQPLKSHIEIKVPFNEPLQKIYYETLSSRIHEIEVTKPLFSNFNS